MQTVSPVEVLAVRGAVTCGQTGRVIDLGLISYRDVRHPVKSWVMNQLIRLKINYFNRTRRRLLPTIIP